MDSVLEVVSRPGQDLEDAVEGRVGPRDGVRDVGLRGDPVEDWPPGVPCRQGPEGGEDAIDAWVAAITFIQRPLAGGIVDEGHPVLAQVCGEGDHRQDLGQDLQHVDVCTPGIELAYEPAGTEPRGVLRADDVAPTIGAPV